MPRKIINLQDAIDEAKKYKHKSQFEKGSPWAYNKLLRTKSIHLACGHMEPLGNLYHRCIYSISLGKTIYIGLTFNPNERFQLHKINGTPKVKEIISLGATLNVLTDFLPVKEAIEKEIYYIDQYKKDGFKVLNIATGGTIGGKHKKWNKENLSEIAAQYKNKKDFRKNDHLAYIAAKSKGILDEITSNYIEEYDVRKITINEIKLITEKYLTLEEFEKDHPRLLHKLYRNKSNNLLSHMVTKRKVYWTDEECINESLKYETKHEFSIGSPGQYAALRARCRKRKEPFCPHMKNFSKSDSPETRLRKSKASKGRRHSKETLARMSAIKKEYWNNRKDKDSIDV